MFYRVPICLIAILFAAAVQAQTPPRDLVIKNATLLTTHGRIANGSVVVHGGKIAAFGASVAAPAGAQVIDAGGKYVTGRRPPSSSAERWGWWIDAHSHMALGEPPASAR
jgi:cytosine/adenosine deaminase-related metal-dependent hydrolase